MNKNFTSAPVFVIGAERSGTTMLRLMLSSSKELCIPPESIFLTELYSKYRQGLDSIEQIPEFISNLYSIFFFDQWHLDPNLIHHRFLELESLSYQNMMECIYRTYLIVNEPDSIQWGDKNPIHTLRTNIILDLFPNARFIHIVRDGRDAVLSQRETNWGKTRSIEKATQLWVRYVTAGNLLANQRPEQCIQIKYEQLVSTPVEALKYICNFLDITYSENMLEFHLRNRRENLVPIEQQDYHKLTLESIDTSRVERWRDKLDIEEISSIELIAGEALERNSYKLETI
ncbi:sulfotransferase [Candidatus Dojkabacteria bacterium]|uniref:Sulfotransferase n=1 Tax=Candidatus Dojkabacteria bacterium TaxID=2099670 RepID=A0A955LAK1_9BACT|nr:sulfotransferase [Candidatus Dojkabacteria bacterium]